MIRRPWLSPSTRKQAAGRSGLGDDAGANGVVDVVVEIGDPVGNGDDLALERRRCAALLMVQNPVPHLKGQVEARAVILQKFYDAQALDVVLKPARHQLVEHALAAVPKRGVAPGRAP